MSTPEKIRAFLESATEQPAKSKLETYAEVIRTLRRKRWTYRRIAAALHDEFGLPVAPSTIHNFVKVRARRRGEYSLEQAPQPAPAPKAAEAQPTARPRFNIDA